ncbi:plasmid maintenance protein [Borreliella bavariensis]|uniref:plasmid maintenance protein n=1 Tax=Borreliella bavariensis TaxID=664662 RepID=UPI001F17BEC6|nr:plasmid maintenance protein [Borreliella bavariensis]
MNNNKTERHYATYHFTDTRLKQDTKIVNNTRKLYLEILEQNSKKTEIYLSKIFSCLKGLFKALKPYQNTIVSLKYYPKHLGPENRLKDTLGVYVKNLQKTKKKATLLANSNKKIREAYFMNLYNSRIDKDTKIVNNKKYIFRKLHLQILEENSKKIDPNLKEISDLRLSSHIGRKEIEYQRLLKVSWFLEMKYQEYLQSNKLKTYQIRDVLAGVNSMLAKENYKTITKKTIQRDLKKLVEMGLVTKFSKSLGKDNGGFSLYKPNISVWQHRVEIIRAYFENEVVEYTKEKKVVTMFKKEIDELTFPSMSTPSMSTPLLHKEDKYKIKNSIEENFFENIEKNYEEKKPKKENQNLIEKKGVENELKKEKIEKQIIEKENNQKKGKKEKMKFAYKTSFAEYQETKLTTKYKISPNHFVDLYGFSNNSNTYTNSLINLEYFLVYLSQEYHVNDIVKFYVAKFKSKYKGKIWFTSPKSKVNDFFDLVGEFKDTYKSIYNGDSEQRVVFQGQSGYFDGSIFRKVDSDSNIAELVQNVWKGLNNAN